MNTLETLPADGPMSVVVDGPNEKPYPGYAREMAAIAVKAAKASRAQSEPFPGPLLDAFVNDAPVVHGFKLQPVAMGLIMILKKIQSPLLEIVRIMREEFTRPPSGTHGDDATRENVWTRINERLDKEVSAEDEQFVETIFCFIHPLNEIRLLLNSGRAAFRERALREISDRVTTAQMADLQKAVSMHYRASFATVINHSPPSAEGGTVFTPPPAGAQMALAGGSTCSAR
jgi:hypothetical protein